MLTQELHEPLHMHICAFQRGGARTHTPPSRKPREGAACQPQHDFISKPRWVAAAPVILHINSGYAAYFAQKPLYSAGSLASLP